jgi:3-isopropylmalate/(R)-2-methylmalate dehydratase small subunit
MRMFEAVSGVAALLDQDNIDTDQILPSAFMRGADPDYAAGLFAIWRRNPDFVLSRPGWAQTRILVAGANFGCGSTREHAIWALDGYGIRVLIALSFGEVFRDNGIKNGLLPIVAEAGPHGRLIQLLRAAPDPVTLAVDLQAQTVSGPDGFLMPFDIPPADKRALIEGLDDIGMTLLEASAITAWEQSQNAARPWRQTLRMPP